MNEVIMLKRLKHPGIIRLYNIYDSVEYVHLVFEYIRDTQIFYIIKEKSNYTETDAIIIMRSLLQSIFYMHLNQVIYRDIKPGNIFLV